MDVVDETFLAVPPERLAAEFADPAAWRRLWPDLALRVFTDRGAQGVRWSVVGDGTVLHWFLRVDPVGEPLSRRAATREGVRRQRAAKAVAFALKDRLEAGRPPGVPPGGEAPVTSV